MSRLSDVEAMEARIKISEILASESYIPLRGQLVDQPMSALNWQTREALSEEWLKLLHFVRGVTVTRKMDGSSSIALIWRFNPNISR